MLEKMKQEMEKVLSPKRYTHSVNVMKLSGELAERWGYPEEKAELAGILHDCAKELDDCELLRILDKLGDQVDDTVRSMRSLWHAPVGAVLCKEKYGIDDDDIYEAVFYHTTGKPDMGLLAQIIFIADLIEEGRDDYFPWAPAMRELAKKDLQEALLGVMDRSLESLIEQRKCIYPLTVVARNRLLQNK